MSKFFSLRTTLPVKPASELTPTPNSRLPVLSSSSVDKNILVFAVGIVGIVLGRHIDAARLEDAQPLQVALGRAQVRDR